MKRSPRFRSLQALSLVFAALPVAFAVIRAVRTGHDVRYLWVALAALLGAATVMAIGQGSRRTPLAAVTLSAAALVAALLLATLAALLLGTTFGRGILVVTFSFALCCAASCFVYMLATDRTAQ